MTDADVDGQHIKALLLTLFFRYTPRLIEAGHIFIAVAPFFKIKKSGKDHYVYSKDELDAFYITRQCGMKCSIITPRQVSSSEGRRLKA